MNKLSELSKPVAWEVKGILCHSEEEAQVYVGEPEPLYSQEYVSALLAELESKSAYAADWCHLATKRKDELEDANKRIAELEAIRSDASQVFKEIGSELGCDPDNESIMVAVDDLKATQMTGPLKDVLKRNIELEAKLATPVRLGAGVLMFSAYSANSCDSEWHLCLARDSVVSAIRAAGFTVGDE
ncbi:hypothetical protein [Serratia liquefaciens]|uniref:hypothetical protein n=1 Tax=Serratia liquefaciens TaxID=614 RepID=UPI00217B64D7|nr:hypothetical protein [Serratia liquefaciens]CAI1613098.1 Uncharacterised protein [Serratia liquefaciens]